MLWARRTAFTLLELLIVIAILSVLVGILVPALRHVKEQARQIRSTGNQKGITSSVTYYALDHRGRFPPSVATMGSRGSYWNWLEPTTLITYFEENPLHKHRSLSGYLFHYIEDPTILYCPNVPEKYPYMHEAWEAGDEWVDPETGFKNAVFGSYSFYWGYLGYRQASRNFHGPHTTSQQNGQSTLLVSDTFMYNNWRSPDAYLSCEKFKRGGCVPRSAESSSYWYRLQNDDSVTMGSIQIKLQAGFVDGHVERYTTGDIVPMQVSITPDGSAPHTIFGEIFLPQSSRR